MLTKEDLQKIIDQFDEAQLKREGIFGISQYDEGTDDSYIRANKEGLELFALELLKVVRDTDTTLSDTEKTIIIPFDYDENWIDENSDIFIQHIELITSKQKSKPKSEHKSSLADKLMPYGCGLALLLLLVSAIIGLWTLYTWLF